jgi:hypothetical protein
VSVVLFVVGIWCGVGFVASVFVVCSCFRSFCLCFSLVAFVLCSAFLRGTLCGCSFLRFVCVVVSCVVLLSLWLLRSC